jgi:hypothetical protein
MVTEGSAEFVRSIDHWASPDIELPAGGEC